MALSHEVRSWIAPLCVLLLQGALQVNGSKIEERLFVAANGSERPVDGVAILIVSFDGPNAKKFWPQALRGAARNIAAQSPGKAWKLYFSNEELNPECLVKDLPVPVNFIRTGKRPHDGSGYIWAMKKSLEQIKERWLVYMQEDVGIPFPESTQRLQRIQQFAEEKEASFIHLERPDAESGFLWRSAAVFHQKDLGFSFNRQGGGAYAFNHGFSFSDRLWFLDWISKNPGEGDPWSAENDQFVDSKKLKNMYFLSFDSTVGAGCYFPGKPDSVRNDVACKAPLKRVPGPPMGLDKVMRFGSISYGTVKNHLGRYAAHVLESLDLPVEFDRDRQENLVFTSSQATKCLDVP